MADVNISVEDAVTITFGEGPPGPVAEGGSSLTVSDTAPVAPEEGDQWFNSSNGKTYVYYDSQWVSVNTTSAPAWADVTGKPSSFTPSAHTHLATEVTDLGDSATLDVGTTAGTVAAGDHTHVVADITDSTTVGRSLLTVANPSAITFPRINADNTVTMQTASAHLDALGGQSAGKAIFAASAYTGAGSVRKLAGIDVDDSPSFTRVSLGNGTAAAPAITFGESNTGIFRPSVERFGFAAAGSEILTGYINGCYLSSGKAFGINTSNWLRVGTTAELTTTAGGGTFTDLKLRNLISAPGIGTTVTPASNGDLVMEATSNTSVTIKLKGSDGTVRSVVLTLS